MPTAGGKSTLTDRFSTAKIANLKKTSSLPSLEGIKKTLEKKEEIIQEENKVPEKREAFTLEQLKSAWDAYLQHLKQNNRDLEYVALNHEFELVNSETIKITLANKFQEKSIENLKPDLLGELRGKLNNSFIDLQIDFQKIDEKQLRYTNREKFDYLAQKYPLLSELKNRLDLDPDF